ncbi:hypothetical protein BGX29_003140 [Mortierella sp. GBA35]|nr:hypothetical protein BGX29_003140 [Mortierella sp. GBA35]
MTSKPIHHLPPEILESIFHHLNQGTLRQNISLVCKQWHLTSNRLIHRVAIWEPVRKQDKKFHALLLDRLCQGQVDTFEVWVLNGSRHPHKKLGIVSESLHLWKDFVAAANGLIAQQEEGNSKQIGDGNNTNKEEEKQKWKGGRLFESIRHLKIYGDQIDTMRIVRDLKPCFQYLESFKVEIFTPVESHIDIFTILDNGPRLKNVEFKISRSNYFEVVQVGATASTPTATQDQAFFDEQKPQDLSTPEGGATSSSPHTVTTTTNPQDRQKARNYALEEFILGGACIDIPTAERLIKQCPNLRVLKSLWVLTDHSRSPGWDTPIIKKSSERLTRLARDHCPNLQWYQSDLMYHHRLPNETRLVEIAQMFPEMQTLSMNSYEDPGPVILPHLQPVSFPKELGTFLERLRKLEVQCGIYSHEQWSIVNRVICLALNLEVLLVPDTMILPHTIGRHTTVEYDDYDRGDDLMLDWMHESDQERERRERAERQLFRREILCVQDPSSPLIRHRDDGRPYPRIWPCRHWLKMLDCGIYGFGDLGLLTSHIRNYRLFGQLTVFKIACNELQVGQLQDCTPPKKKQAKSSKTTFKRQKDVIDRTMERHRNNLLALKGLVYLEEFVAEVTRLPGTVVVQDFEFLRRREPDFGTRVFPPPFPHSPLRTRATSRGRKNTGCNGEGSEEDSEDEHDFGEVEEYKGVETFWPRLHTFHVNYLSTSSLNNTKALVSGLEQLRPGVDFRFKRSFNSPR